MERVLADRLRNRVTVQIDEIVDHVLVDFQRSIQLELAVRDRLRVRLAEILAEILRLEPSSSARLETGC
jgi:hypothetical protein